VNSREKAQKAHNQKTFGAFCLPRQLVPPKPGGGGSLAAAGAFWRPFITRFSALFVPFGGHLIEFNPAAPGTAGHPNPCPSAFICGSLLHGYGKSAVSIAAPTADRWRD
jgi:hypothetical protein